MKNLIFVLFPFLNLTSLLKSTEKSGGGGALDFEWIFDKKRGAKERPF